MALILDVYEESTFLGSIGIEAGALVIEGPEKGYLATVIKEDFPGMVAEEVVREFPKKFRGVTHCKPHGAPTVVHPDK